MTLITGDRVIVGQGNGAPAVRVEPGPGRAAIGFLTHRHRDEVIVIPQDVAALVADGRLDRALFDVTRLLADGYGDAERADLPLIVSGLADAAAARQLATPGITVDRTLPALRVTALRQHKSNGGAILAGLANRSAAAGGAQPTIRLDRFRQPHLDRSRPQIGAPAAWASGYTGAGVVVAVLDTGIDATHPDLAGQILDAQAFVDDGAGPSDVVGHGTHVASTIAGTGAASSGLYRGVAPDAKLLDARVCELRGCPDSAILAGMEWAVVTKQAKIVNMSLGGPDEPGLDVIEQAVNELSAQHGALFVISAGNGGEWGERVSSPASADAALAVGAVDDREQIAEFSSQGPRTGDSAIKPDITAPGVGIAAARAHGISGIGTPIDENYTRSSGTSMAAPMVSAAAAILRQQHGDWTGEQIKIALTGAAQPNPELTPFAQGAGRLDIARAIRQPVVARPSSLSFGVAVYPHGDDPVLTQTITYRNDGAAPIELTLTATLSRDGGATPAGLLELPASVVVPAGGTADVAVIVDTRGDVPDGAYSGAVVASAGDVRIVTPLAVEREPEMYDLTLQTLGATGEPASALVFVMVQSGLLRILDVDGQVTLRLRPRQYSFFASLDSSTLVRPRFSLTQNTTLVMDGRIAKPIAPTIAGTAASQGSTEVGYWDAFDDNALLWVREGATATAHLGPALPDDEFFSWAVTELFSEGAVYLLGRVERGHLVTDWREAIAPNRLATVDATHAGREDKRYHKYALYGFTDPPPSERGLAFGPGLGRSEFHGPLRRTEYYYGAGLTWIPVLEQLPESGPPIAEFVEGLQQREYRAGRTYTEHWLRAPAGPSFAEMFGESRAMRSGNDLRVSPSLFGGERPGFSTGDHGLRAALYKDGVPLLEFVDEPRAFFPTVEVPPERAHYRFEQEMTRSSEIAELSTHVAAAWTFTSERTAESTPLALPVLRFTPALDEHDRAPRGIPLLLPLAIERPAGAPAPSIAHIAVEASFDDGATWSTVLGIRFGTRWLGIVQAPASARYVSLRGSARDVAHNTVDQMIIRAYALAP